MSTPPIETPARARRRGTYSEVARQRLIESRLTPNAISLTGFVLCVVAAVLVWQEHLFWGGLAFVVGSVCDTLDGRYSRMSGKGTQFGAFLDSTLDRIEEGVVLAAVAVLFSQDGEDGAVAAVVIAVLASLMVSYTRARAEALGVECKVGIADRAVRVVILSAGLLLDELRARRARARRLRARRAVGRHGAPAHLPRALAARPRRRRRVTQPLLRGYVPRSIPTGGSRTCLHTSATRRPPTAEAGTRTRRCGSPSSASATAPTPSSRASTTTGTPTRTRPSPA